MSVASTPDTANGGSGILVINTVGGQAGTMALSEREKSILDFERTWWTEDGVKEALLRERFQCSPDDYYNELNRLLDTPDALAYDPLVVRRLHRARDRRRRMRLDGTSDTGGMQV